MHDADVHTALATLVPPFEHTRADWDDVLRRGGVAAAPARRRRLVPALAVATVLAVALGVSPLGRAFVDATVGELSSWLGSAPGSPAPADEQNGFDAANTNPYAHFPAGTRVGLVDHGDVDGARYDLLGFRDGDSYCLRLVPVSVPARADSPADCAPRPELDRLAVPGVALAAGTDFWRGSDGDMHGVDTVYGLSGDGVTRVDVVDAAGARHAATVENNTFLYVARYEGSQRFSATRLEVTTSDGRTTSVPVAAAGVSRAGAADVPGPARADRTSDSDTIGWLERREARGEPFTWPTDGGDPPQEVSYARLIQPLPGSSFRLGVGVGDGHAWPVDGHWYCLAWLWPLVKVPQSYGCARAETLRAGGMLEGVSPGRGQQFPLYVGLVSDDVASAELFFRNGDRRQLPIVDNAIAFQVWQGEPVRLVTYDAAGRVLGTHVI